MSEKELLKELAEAVIEYNALRDKEQNYEDEHGNELEWDDETAEAHEELVSHLCAKRAKVAALLCEALGKEVEF